MHLTRCEINTARRGARELLTSPQRMHAAVLAGFPASHREPTTAGRVLWRVDRHPHRTLLYILSPHQPDLTHLVEAAGWPTIQKWDTRSYAPLLERITTGGQWGFRLTANPVHNSRRNDQSPQTQRFGHVTVTQQTQWLLDRAERNGFTISAGVQDEPDVAVHARHTWRFARTDRATRKQGTVTLATATFEGRLEVTDPAVFRHALTHGIGPAKGYGCGLLTLAPVS